MKATDTCKLCSKSVTHDVADGRTAPLPEGWEQLTITVGSETILNGEACNFCLAAVEAGGLQIVLVSHPDSPAPISLVGPSRVAGWSWTQDAPQG